MYTLFIVLIVIAALLMIGIVLIQESKGGGLASQFSGYNQIGGVRKTTDFIEKTTWGLAACMVIISVLCHPFIAADDIPSCQEHSGKYHFLDGVGIGAGRSSSCCRDSSSSCKGGSSTASKITSDNRRSHFSVATGGGGVLYPDRGTA